MVEKKKNARIGRRRRLAALAILLAVLCGCMGFWQTAQVMADTTRSGQVLAAVALQNGSVDFTLMGRHGSLPYTLWGSELLENLTALPAAGRLLLWGSLSLKELWGREILPFLTGFLY